MKGMEKGIFFFSKHALCVALQDFFHIRCIHTIYFDYRFYLASLSQQCHIIVSFNFKRSSIVYDLHITHYVNNQENRYI